jgi:hypothetical protein
MKKLILTIAALAAISTAINAQESNAGEIKTLFGGTDFQSLGGYGALTTGYTKVNNLDAIYFGARGAVIINHSFALGLGGNGFISEPVNDKNLNNDFEFAGGYGGLVFEPIIGARQPIHLSFPILVGAGGIGYTQHWGDQYDEDKDFNDYNEDSKAFFVFEPGVEIEFNMIKFMRVAITGSYRYTSDINLKYKEHFSMDSSSPGISGTSIAPGDLLRGFNVGLIMKFGKF